MGVRAGLDETRILTMRRATFGCAADPSRRPVPRLDGPQILAVTRPGIWMSGES